jgi:glycosyltransferase involved in cell wall biosynthesis
LFRSLDRTRVRPWLATLTLEADLAKRLRDLDVEVTNLDLRGALTAHTFRSVRALASEARRRGTDLVHGYLFQGNLLAAAISWISGAPCITSVRNLDIGKKGYQHFASSRAHRMALKVLFNSQAVRDHVIGVERIDASRTVVIANGVPDPFPGVGDSTGPRIAWLEQRAGPTAICVASLRSKKGHVHLFEAFRRVRKRVPAARLLLVGEGPLAGALEREAAGPDLGGAVYFAGYRADVAALLSRCDIFVLSSLEEGMPNALLEAMAAGIPSVVTDVGGNAEVVEDGITGYLVPASDPEALAGRLTDLLLDADLRRGQGEAARQRFESRFTLDRMTSAYHALYDEVLERSGR